MKLTSAQRFTLEVIHDADKPVRGGKHRSAHAEYPRSARANSTAAFSLVELKLVRSHILPHASPFVSGYKFEATPAGCSVLGFLRQRERRSDEP